MTPQSRQHKAIVPEPTPEPPAPPIAAPKNGNGKPAMSWEDFKRLLVEQTLKGGPWAIGCILMGYFWVMPALEDQKRDRADQRAAFTSQQTFLADVGKTFVAQKDIQASQLEAITKQTTMLSRQSEMLDKQTTLIAKNMENQDRMMKLQRLALQKLNVHIPAEADAE